MVGLSHHTMRGLCRQGRIRGAEKVGGVWWIPLPLVRLDPPQKRRRVPKAGTAERLRRAGVQFGYNARLAAEIERSGMDAAQAADHYGIERHRLKEALCRAAALRERNLAVIAARESGEPQVRIAERHGLSSARVSQICRWAIERIERLEAGESAE